jgi:hypothetical protein
MTGYERLEDATYVAVGALVLTYQRAQVQRREVERFLERVRRQLADALAVEPDAPQPASPKG